MTVGRGTYDADVDLVAGGEGGVTGDGDGMLQGQVLHHVQVPQLLAHVLHGQTLGDTAEKRN